MTKVVVRAKFCVMFLLALAIPVFAQSNQKTVTVTFVRWPYT